MSPAVLPIAGRAGRGDRSILMNNRPADRLAICCAQLNATVGDIAGNADKVRRARERGRSAGRRSRRLSRTVHRRLSAGRPGAQAGLPGRLPRRDRNAGARNRDGGPALLVGTPWVDDGKLYNAVALLDGGTIAALRFKVDLPNYGVFDEKRVFAPGPMPGPVNFRGVRLGVPICEDIWGEEVVECLAETGAEILIVPNGSPYWRQKGDVRLNIAVARVTETGLPLIYVNQVGGQDELVFDGVSFGLQCRLLAGVPDCRLRGSASSPRNGCGSGGTWRLRQRPDGRRRSRPSAPTTPPACWACATTSTRTAFPASCSACPAASIRRSGRGDGGRCAWARTASAASCCRTTTPRRNRSTMRPPAPRRSAFATTSCRSRRRSKAWKQALAPAFAGTHARRHRRKPAVARARHDPDGDLQQVRSDGRHHRQQVGDVGRLRHALWRHERRLQSDQGSLQDRSVPAVAPAQRVEAGRRARARTASSFRRTSSRGRRRPNCARTRRTRIRCRPTQCSMRSWSGWSSAKSRSRPSSPPASTATRWCASSACSTSPNTSAGRRRRA